MPAASADLSMLRCRVKWKPENTGSQFPPMWGDRRLEELLFHLWPLVLVSAVRGLSLTEWVTYEAKLVSAMC